MLPQEQELSGDTASQQKDSHESASNTKPDPISTYLPVDAKIKTEISFQTPHRGKDDTNPFFVDRYSDGLRFGSEMALRGGKHRVNVGLTIADGKLDLRKAIATLGGIYFYDVSGDTVSGSIFDRSGHLFEAKTITPHEGQLQIQGLLLGTVPFAESLRIFGDENPYVFPYGLDARDRAVCDVEKKSTIATPLETSAQLREQGLPEMFPLSTALKLAEDMAQANVHGGCNNNVHDPIADGNLDSTNVPDWVLQDPLALVSSINAASTLKVTDDQLSLAGLNLPEKASIPGITVNLGEDQAKAKISAQFSNPELKAFNQGERDETKLAELRNQRQLKFNTEGQVDLESLQLDSFNSATVQLAGNTFEIPLTAEAQINGHLQGLFQTDDPLRDLKAHIAMNGLVTATGDIAVPAMQITLSDNETIQVPAIRIKRSAKNLFVGAADLTFDYQANSKQMQGRGKLITELNAASIELDGTEFSGPHQAQLELHADQQAITATLGAQLTLPEIAFPAPVPFAVNAGTLGVNNLQVQVLQDHLGPDHFAGSVSGSVALNDFNATLGEHSLHTQAAVSIEKGQFSFDHGLIDAEANLGLSVDAQLDQQAQQLDMQAHLEVSDYGYSDPEKGLVSRRHIDVSQINGEFNLNAPGIKLRAKPGSFGDGPTTELRGQLVRSGVHLESSLIGQNFGIDSQATINTQVKNLRIKTSQGTFLISGQLVGTSKLVNISENPAQPDFKPVVGGMNLQLKHGSISKLGKTGALPLLKSGTLEIHDNLDGSFEIQAQARHPAAKTLDQLGLNEIRETLGITNNIRTRLNIPELNIGAEGIHYFDPNATAINPTLSTNPIAYYEPEAVDSINAPQFFVHLLSQGSSRLSARGQAEITGLNTQKPQARYQLGVPLRDQDINIEGGNIKVKAGRGGLSLSGKNERLRVSVRPPSKFEVNFKQQKDGLTYVVSGALTPKGNIRATLNLSNPQKPAMKLRPAQHAYSLTGELDVDVLDSTGKTLGKGTVTAETAYQVSGHLKNGQAHFELDVPETVLGGTMTQGFKNDDFNIPAGATLNIPIRGFHGDIQVDARDPQQPRLTSIWDLPRVGSKKAPGTDTKESTVFIPAVEIKGFEKPLKEISAHVALDPQGQQIQVNADPVSGITFESLAGPDGNSRTMRVDYSVNENQQAIVLTGHVASSAQVEGSISPEQDTLVNISSLQISSENDGGLGKPIPLALNFNGLDALSAIPGMQINYKPATKELHFTATGPSPKLPEDPTSFEDFFKWTHQQWQNYRQELATETHLARLSPTNVKLLRDLGRQIPPGSGDIIVNLTQDVDITVTLDDSLAEQLKAVGTELETIIDIRRELPAPPACTTNNCAPLVYSEGQNSEGILYFTRTLQETGRATIDDRVPAILRELIATTKQVKETDKEGNVQLKTVHKGQSIAPYKQDQQIALPELFNILSESPALKEHYQTSELKDVLFSYLTPQTRTGTHRALGLRGLIALTNIRRSSFSLYDAKDGFLTHHAHAFDDDSYHSISKAEGSDMQLLSTLPASPKQVEALLLDTSKQELWDSWNDQVSGKQEESSGRLLRKYNYTVTTETAQQGQVRIIHFQLTPKAGNDLEAYTRTVRLMPSKNITNPEGQTVSQGTLILWDEHIDFTGPDNELPYPRTRLPQQPKITKETFLNSALRAVQPPASNTLRFAGNRFATTMSRLQTLIENPQASNREIYKALAVDSSRAEQTETVLLVDFLTYQEPSEEDPEAKATLKISDTVKTNLVKRYFTDSERLDIPAADVQRWVTAGEVPLDELRTAAKMDHIFPQEAFNGLAQMTLSPPEEIAEIGKNFGSPTERYFVILSHIKKRFDALSSSNHPVDTIVFQRNSFHPNLSQDSRNQGDTVDTVTLYYIPPTVKFQGKSVTPDIGSIIHAIHHAEDYARIYPESFSLSKKIDHNTLTNPAKAPTLTDPTTFNKESVYTQSRIKLPGGLQLDYLIESNKEPFTLNEAARASAWALAESSDLNDFSDNVGIFETFSLENNAGLIVREGIINSRPSGSDNTGDVAKEGIDGTINFGSALVSAGIEYQVTGKLGWDPSHGAVTGYSPGVVVNERGQKVDF